MKQIFRNFIHVVKRFKTSSILNMLGLSAAFAVFIVVMMQVYYDFRFNAKFKNSADTYLLVSNRQMESRENISVLFDSKTMESLTDKFPEIGNYTMVGKQYQDAELYLTNKEGDKTKHETTVSQINADFFEIFTPRIIEGDATNLVVNPHSLMVSKSEAEKLFGVESAVGKTIDIELSVPHTVKTKNFTYFTTIDSLTTTKIVAVYEDFPTNCSLENGFYIYRNPQQYVSRMVYMQIAPNAIDALRAKLNSKEVLDEFLPNNESATEATISRTLELKPIKNIHFDLKTIIKDGKSIDSVYSLLAIGLATLVIAFINFINFTTAMAPARVRTLNLQKILGASTASLRIIIACEALLFALLTYLLAIVYIALLKNTILNDFFSASFDLLDNLPAYLGIGILLLAIGLLVGVYPALYITSFNSVAALNTSSSGGGTKNNKLRATLVTIQYMGAISLIIIAIVINIQHSYMQNFSLGIDKENVVFVEIKKPNKSASYLTTTAKNFAEEVSRNSDITSYTLSQQIPGKSRDEYYSFQQNTEEKTITYKYNSWQVDANFVDFFKLEIAEGTNFRKDESIPKQVMINEKFVKSHDITDVFETKLPASGNEYLVPAGVLKDFNTQSVEFGIPSSLFFIVPEEDRLSYAFFKVSGQNTIQAIKDIENTWSKFSTEPFKVEFLDASIAHQYKEYNNLAKLITVFSIIAILIAIMGVYGLITFNSKYRAREIAVRKVNGAEEKEIILMLNKGMLVQLLLGFVIATPLAYYIVNKWLEQFAYKTPIYWWIFALGGLIILLITILTVSVQSYRAAIENPVKALKSE